MIFVVKYTGPFGFIKPWTAVRDEQTYSQQFLTPSIAEGMEKKLFPKLLSRKGLQGYIVGHRINYRGISCQQETTWSKAWIEKRADPIIQQRPNERGTFKEIKVPTITRRPATSILTRGVLLEPTLYLAFPKRLMAHLAVSQHICLCRNEDVLLPVEAYNVSPEEWYSPLFPGYELTFKNQGEQTFKVGYNRYADAQPMFGDLFAFGNPIQEELFSDADYERRTKTFNTQDAIKPRIKNNIASFVKVECRGYHIQPTGGVSNLHVTIENTTSYFIENVKVKITILKGSGSVLLSKTIDSNGIYPYAKRSIPLENTTQGSEVKYEMVSITSAALDLP